VALSSLRRVGPGLGYNDEFHGAPNVIEIPVDPRVVDDVRRRYVSEILPVMREVLGVGGSGGIAAVTDAASPRSDDPFQRTTLVISGGGHASVVAQDGTELLKVCVWADTRGVCMHRGVDVRMLMVGCTCV
jgi:hypothetical protein